MFTAAEPGTRLAKFIATFALAATFGFVPAWGDGLRCGVRVVDAGLQMFEVLQACGEPTQVTRSAIQRPLVVWVHGRPYSDGTIIDVAVETWVYNFGSARLMRQLRFEDGVLVEVISLGRGNDER
jgi:Protein of unknown function (DUF2845)